MPTAHATLLETRLEEGSAGGRISCPSALQPAPGQYLAANSAALVEALPIILYPASLPGPTLGIAPPLPTHWKAGTELVLRGPFGNGFKLPSNARRVALAPFQSSAALLAPLAVLALRHGAAVTLFCAIPPVGLPPEVEILPLDLLPEASGWADYLAAAFPRDQLSSFRRQAALRPHQPMAYPAQALVLTPMPCTGLGECGACAVATRHSWKLACSDGPVFNIETLEVEE